MSIPFYKLPAHLLSQMNELKKKFEEDKKETERLLSHFEDQLQDQELEFNQKLGELKKESKELRGKLDKLENDVEERCEDNEWTIEEEEDETITDLQDSLIDLKEKFNNIPPLYRGDYDVR